VPPNKKKRVLCTANQSTSGSACLSCWDWPRLLFLALKAGNMSTLSFSKTYTVTGKFDNIGGLKPQAPVKSAGVVVGRVGDIKFDDKSYQGAGNLGA
jgi:hypothetical protein